MCEWFFKIKLDGDDTWKIKYIPEQKSFQTKLRIILNLSYQKAKKVQDRKPNSSDSGVGMSKLHKQAYKLVTLTLTFFFLLFYL